MSRRRAARGAIAFPLGGEIKVEGERKFRVLVAAGDSVLAKRGSCTYFSCVRVSRSLSYDGSIDNELAEAFFLLFVSGGGIVVESSATAES